MQEQQKVNAEQKSLSTGSNFVRVSADRTHLCLNDGKPWYFCGANCYYLMVRIYVRL
jgi:hypothetical protein